MDCFLIGLLFSCESEIYFENAYCIEKVNVVDPSEGLKKRVNVVIKGNKNSWYGTQTKAFSKK